MEIQRTQRDGYLEMFFEGRLDGYWARHLAESVGEVMREGTHSVRLNLSKTAYMSSAGIGMLMQIYKDFAAVNGSFTVVEPSPQVRQIIDMVGLRAMLFEGASLAAAAAATGAAAEVEAAAAPLVCRVSGDPRLLPSAAFTEADCHTITADEDCLAIGLGALGEGFANCQERFGEFLAVAGAAAYQPSDGTNFPDYMVASGAFVPRVTALYGLLCRGDLRRQVRFEEPAPLSRIVEQCVAAAAAPAAGIVILAESAGLVGAMLKRPPVHGGSPFGYPEIQDWLSFSPERCYPRHRVLLVGVAGTAPPAALRPFLRPLARGSNLLSHFHAAAFGYRPLPKGRLDLNAAVRGLFESGGPEGVLHLLGDDRERGAGESELLRGACWVGAIPEAAE